MARSSGCCLACTRRISSPIVGDTIVLTALMFTKHGRAKRFGDVSDNAFYWYFVVGAWLPIYYLVYWFPTM